MCDEKCHLAFGPIFGRIFSPAHYQAFVFFRSFREHSAVRFYDMTSFDSSCEPNVNSARELSKF